MASVVMGRTGVDRGVGVILAIAGLVAIAVAVFHATFANLLTIWMGGNYKHCLFIFPIALYLLWERRAVLRATPVKPSWLGVGAAVAVALAWQLAQATGTNLLEHIAAILAIPVLVLAVLGVRMLRAALFPVLFLLAAVPVGDGFIPFLMGATVDVSVTLLQLVGIPVYHEGVFVSLPGGEFKVADVCAGLNYLLAAVTLSLPMSERFFESARARTLFVLFAAVLFIVGNGVRAFIVMMVASATELRHFAGHDHVVFGMIFFVFLFALLMWVGTRYANRKPIAAAILDASPPPLDASDRKRGLLAGAATVVVLALFPTLHAAQASGPRPQIAAIEIAPPAGCSALSEWTADWSPKIHDPDRQLKASYLCGDVTLHVFAAAYAEHQQGREIVGSDNILVPTKWWWSDSRADSDFNGVALNEVRMDEAGQPALVAWYWYSVNGKAVRTELQVKLQEVLAALTFRPTESRAYVIAAYGPSRDLKELREHVATTAGTLLNGSGR